MPVVRLEKRLGTLPQAAMAEIKKALRLRSILKIRALDLNLQFAAARGARIWNPGLCTIPKISDDHL